MKNRFNRIISFLCALMMICAFCAWTYAEEDPATPTDLIQDEEAEQPEPALIPADEPQQGPAAEPAEEPQAEPEEEPEEAISSVEVVVTKTLAIGGSWEGRAGKTKPAVLKLDISQPATVYMLVEGKDVWASVEKADQRTDNPPQTRTDPETDRMIISWEAETGSYLITLGPVEPNLLALAKVTFMDTQTYTAWEASDVIPSEEGVIPSEEDVIPSEVEGSPSDVIPSDAPVISSEAEKSPPDVIPSEEDVIPSEVEGSPSDVIPSEAEGSPSRHITVDVTWDVPNPVIGDTAHFQAILEGYDNLTYTMQWQYGPDNETWYDIPGETEPTMDVVVNEENNLYYWRIIVYIEDDQEI